MISLLGLLLSPAARPADLPHPPRIRERSLALEDGGSLRYWEGPERGPPLILLHGFGGDALANWRPQLRVLSRDYHLILPDLLWFGESRGGSEAPGLDAQTRAMEQLMQAEGLRRACWMGLSYGGLVASWLAQEQPERVSALVLVASPGPVLGPEDLLAIQQRFGVEELSEIFVPAHPEDIAPLLGLVSSLSLPERLYPWLHGWMIARHPEEQRALLADLETRLAGAQGLDWSSPEAMLLIGGEEDPLFPAELTVTLHQRFPSELLLLPEAGHAPHLEQPAAVRAELLPWLAENCEGARQEYLTSPLKK